ncbi:hypothetical protein Dimus_038128 [Dionaea muscipula]
MQFLMGLDDLYDTVRSSILSMDPFPTINKAFYIFQQVEQQKQITSVNTTDNSIALLATKQGNKRGIVASTDNRKGRGLSKKRCDHCKEDGHSIDQCFEIIGYPDWYKGKKGKKQQFGSKFAAQAGTRTPSPMGETREASLTPFDMDEKGAIDPNLVSAVCQQLMKMFEKSETDINNSSINNSFAGNSHLSSR